MPLARVLLVLCFLFSSNSLPGCSGSWLDSLSLRSPFCFPAVEPGMPAHLPQWCPWSLRPPCSCRTRSVVGPAVCPHCPCTQVCAFCVGRPRTCPRRVCFPESLAWLHAGGQIGFHLSFLHIHIGPMSGLSLTFHSVQNLSLGSCCIQATSGQEN